jgi:hypothetical protein
MLIVFASSVLKLGTWSIFARTHEPELIRSTAIWHTCVDGQAGRFTCQARRHLLSICCAGVVAIAADKI